MTVSTSYAQAFGGYVGTITGIPAISSSAILGMAGSGATFYNCATAAMTAANASGAIYSMGIIGGILAEPFVDW